MNTCVLENVDVLTKSEIDRLRRLVQPYCDEYGMTQSELAAQLGVKQSTISAFTTGRLTRPGDWIGQFAVMVEGWEPEAQNGGFDFKISTEQILTALSAVHKSGDVDLLRRIGKAHADIEDLQKKAARVRKEIESIVEAAKEQGK